MRLPDLRKRTVRLLEAIDKNVPTETQKTEDQYIQLINSLVRPIARDWVVSDSGGDR